MTSTSTIVISDEGSDQEDHPPAAQLVAETLVGLKKKKKCRIQAKKFFLTFPKCTVDPQLALTRLIFKFPKLKWIIVAREKHEDGTPHLHLAFYLSKQLRFTDVNYWDFIAMKHGNYQVMRDPKKVVKYVTKYKDYLTHGIDVESWLKARKTKTSTSFNLVAKLMQDGKSLEELDEDYPGMIANNLQKLQKYDKFLVRKKRKLEKAKKDEWVPLPVLSLPQDFRVLGRWLNTNLSGRVRPFKQKQLWLWGASNLGKTTLVMKLTKFFRVYQVPMDTGTLDEYEDTEYDLIVLDEFKGQKSITWMNGFVQGGHFPVHRRYQGTLKVKNLPVIVLSNYSIEQAYEKVHRFNPNRLDSIKNRFWEVKVTRFISVL